MAVKPPRSTDLPPGPEPEPTADPDRPGAARADRPEPDRSRPDGVPATTTTPARLSHDANFYRAAHARSLGLDGAPDAGDVLEGAHEAGQSLAELLPSARSHGHPDLPEVDTRPPPFLSPLAAMKDIYLRVKGRASPKTTDLLEGVDLEDLLAALKALFESDSLLLKAEARVASPIYRELRDEPGPLLLGLNDPRLTELWRLFLDGWDLWVPEGHDAGVELFWEGEAEDDAGRPVEVMQSLTYIDDEVTLHTKLGEVEDHLTFDGQSFYRLRRRGPDGEREL